MAKLVNAVPSFREAALKYVQCHLAFPRHPVRVRLTSQEFLAPWQVISVVAPNRLRRCVLRPYERFVLNDVARRWVYLV